MGTLGRAAVLAAIGVLGMAPAASFGQAAPAAPPAAAPGPDAGAGDPAVPEGQPPAPVLPVPPRALPRSDPAPGMGGRDCEHERSPGTGV